MNYFGGDVIRKIRTPGRLKFPAGYVPTPIERINIVTEGTCLAILNDVVIPNLSSTPPAFEGTGVVTCAGGSYLRLAYASISKLREVNASIPVQIWHLNESEVAGHEHKFDKLNVEFRNAEPHFDREVYRHRTGWSAKSVAVVHSPFDRTLFLDADSHPLLDPLEICAHDDFLEGLLVFPDGKECRDNNRIFNALGIHYSEDFWEWEAGQFLVEKSTHWKAVQLYAWIAKHGYLFHQVLWGDKEYLPLAAIKMREKFVTSARRPSWEGWGYRHYLSDGTPAFHHILAPKRGEKVLAPPDIEALWKKYDQL